MKDRTIIHIDMDAFFASIEQKTDPSLQGQPVMVCGGLDSRTVVAAASYEAREYGVHAGMSLAVARIKCPDGVFIEGDPVPVIVITRGTNEVVDPSDSAFKDYGSFRRSFTRWGSRT